jgi:hypothetical protein
MRLMDLSKKTPLQKIREEEQLLEKIMLVVPGFSGYKKREERREADKIVRGFLHAKLQDARNDLQDMYQKLAEEEGSKDLVSVDRLVAIFDRVSERVNHASYGYSGFFDAIKIDEDDLDRMIEFDMQLVDGAKGLAERVRDMKNQVRAGGPKDLGQQLSELRDAVEQFESVFDEREEAIQGVEVG